MITPRKNFISFTPTIAGAKSMLINLDFVSQIKINEVTPATGALYIIYGNSVETPTSGSNAYVEYGNAVAYAALADCQTDYARLQAAMRDLAIIRFVD